MRTFQDSLSINRGFGRLQVHKEGWTDGTVATPFGIVSVYSQGDDQNDAHTRLDFVANGRLHMITFHGKRYTSRGLVTVATRFARSCVNASDQATASAKLNQHDK